MDPIAISSQYRCFESIRNRQNTSIAHVQMLNIRKKIVFAQPKNKYVAVYNNCKQSKILGEPNISKYVTPQYKTECEKITFKM